MIGDRLDADVAFGKNCVSVISKRGFPSFLTEHTNPKGVATMLVLSGELRPLLFMKSGFMSTFLGLASLADVSEAGPIVPDFVTEGLSDFCVLGST